jgi:hypothetical protein
LYDFVRRTRVIGKENRGDDGAFEANKVVLRVE